MSVGVAIPSHSLPFGPTRVYNNIFYTKQFIFRNFGAVEYKNILYEITIPPRRHYIKILQRNDVCFGRERIFVWKKKKRQFFSPVNPMTGIYCGVTIVTDFGNLFLTENDRNLYIPIRACVLQYRTFRLEKNPRHCIADGLYTRKMSDITIVLPTSNSKRTTRTILVFSRQNYHVQLKKKIIYYSEIIRTSIVLNNRSKK